MKQWCMLQHGWTLQTLFYEKEIRHKCFILYYSNNIKYPGWQTIEIESGFVVSGGRKKQGVIV